MKLHEIYDLAIALGIKADPRGKREVERLLKKEKEVYDKLEGIEREDYDTDKLVNPFADTRILNGDPLMEVRSIIAGVDMEAQEVILADRLRDRGTVIDLVMSHHPEGKALAALADVMGVQADIWHQMGVPINIGEAVLEGRQSEVMRGILPLNHQRSVDAARLLEMPFMCVHTPCDNLVNAFLQKHFDRKGDGLTLEEVVKELKELPEYRQAARQNAGPTIVVGSQKRRAGKILVDMTGGTGGPAEAIAKLADAGVGTLVGMHISEKNREEAEKSRINVVIAGHDASDSIGINLFVDELENKGIKVLPCSGFTRVSRLKQRASVKK